MNDSLLNLLLGAATVLASRAGVEEDVAELLGIGLAAFRAGSAGAAAQKAVNAELKAMQDAAHVPTREEKDAKYAKILAAIDSVQPA